MPWSSFPTFCAGISHHTSWRQTKVLCRHGLWLRGLLVHTSGQAIRLRGHAESSNLALKLDAVDIDSQATRTDAPEERRWQGVEGACREPLKCQGFSHWSCSIGFVDRTNEGVDGQNINLERDDPLNQNSEKRSGCAHILQQICSYEPRQARCRSPDTWRDP